MKGISSLISRYPKTNKWMFEVSKQNQLKILVNKQWLKIESKPLRSVKKFLNNSV